MATRYEILPQEQLDLLPSLEPLQRLGFVLYGGTAIALHLGHRTSVDFDFFTDRQMDRRAMRSAIPRLSDAISVQDEADAWSVQMSPTSGARPVKVSFFSGLDFGRVGDPQIDDRGHLFLASRDDLLGHKLKVLLQRVDAKDYRDIAAMLEAGQSLSRGLSAAMALFPNLAPCEALKALVYFKDDALDDLSDDDRRTLIAHTKGISAPTVLPIRSRSLSPKP